MLKTYEAYRHGDGETIDAEEHRAAVIISSRGAGDSASNNHVNVYEGPVINFNITINNANEAPAVIEQISMAIRRFFPKGEPS